MANTQDRAAAARAELARRELARRGSSPQADTALKQENTWGNAIKNVGQAGAHVLTGLGGAIAGDVAGLAAIPAHMLGQATDEAMSDPNMPRAAAARYAALANRTKGLGSTQGLDPTTIRDAVSSALTYTPENQDTFSMKAAQLPGKVIGGAGDYLGAQAEKTGVPYLEHVARAVPQAAASYLGVKGAKVSRGMPVPAGKMGNLGSEPIYKTVPNAVTAAEALGRVPDTEELRAAAKKAYDDADEAGIIVPAEGYGKALGKVRTMVKEEGLDTTLHPKSVAVMKRLDEAEGKPLTLQEAETLRKIAMDAEADVDNVGKATPDSRIAGKIVDELDNSVYELSALSPARELWSRTRRSQMIDEMIRRAEIKAGAHYTQAGMEHALRSEFKQLALNPRRMRGLNKEQRAAIEKVAKGGTRENVLRALGKFDPTTSVVSAAGSIGTSAMLSTLNPAAAALPVAGMVGRRAATKMTAKNVDKAREALVGRGIPKATAKTDAPVSATKLRADLRRLDESLAVLPASEAFDSPLRRALQAEAERLRAELSRVESKAVSP